VIHDTGSKESKVLEVAHPIKCAASPKHIAVATASRLRLLTCDGGLVRTVPDSQNANCVCFHPNYNILAFGFYFGSVRLWDVQGSRLASSLSELSEPCSSMSFGADGRLYISSWDKTALIVRLDEQFAFVSRVKLEGHTSWVNDILPLPSSNQCVTCSDDKSVRVWDCRTGECVVALTEHTAAVKALALGPNGCVFASASYDQSVILWTCDTFAVVRRIQFPHRVQSLVFSFQLFVGVENHGVVSCDPRTGEIGSVVVPGNGVVFGLALGVLSLVFVHYHHRHDFLLFLCSTCARSLDTIHACEVALVRTA
jgi:WD40 repeat protein